MRKATSSLGWQRPWDTRGGGGGSEENEGHLWEQAFAVMENGGEGHYPRLASSLSKGNVDRVRVGHTVDA